MTKLIFTTEEKAKYLDALFIIGNDIISDEEFNLIAQLPEPDKVPKYTLCSPNGQVLLVALHDLETHKWYRLKEDKNDSEQTALTEEHLAHNRWPW